MRASAIWKAVTMDRANFLETLLAVLDQEAVRYCVIGGQAVNAYVEPLVSLDLGLVPAAGQIEGAASKLAERLKT